VIAATVRKTREMRKARWEGICRRCGLCCYQKEYRGRTVVTDHGRPCRYLDVASRRCTVYEKRFEMCAQCRKMTILHAMFVQWLPPECGYVRRFRLRRTADRRRLA
jgi:uncharacterized cysteine cluster protein YcgN (CxxCxxCC family)